MPSPKMTTEWFNVGAVHDAEPSPVADANDGVTAQHATAIAATTTTLLPRFRMLSLVDPDTVFPSISPTAGGSLAVINPETVRSQRARRSQI